VELKNIKLKILLFIKRKPYWSKSFPLHSTLKRLQVSFLVHSFSHYIPYLRILYWLTYTYSVYMCGQVTKLTLFDMLACLVASDDLPFLWRWSRLLRWRLMAIAECALIPCILVYVLGGPCFHCCKLQTTLKKGFVSVQNILYKWQSSGTPNKYNFTVFAF